MVALLLFPGIFDLLMMYFPFIHVIRCSLAVRYRFAYFRSFQNFLNDSYTHLLGLILLPMEVCGPMFVISNEQTICLCK